MARRSTRNDPLMRKVSEPGDHHPPRACRRAGGAAKRAPGRQGLSPDVEEDLLRCGASVAVAEADASRDPGRRSDGRRRALRRDGADGHGLCGLHPGRPHLRPDTGKSWEGTGVAPDVAVPADKALDEALKLAGAGVSGQAALAALK